MMINYYNFFQKLDYLLGTCTMVHVYMQDLCVVQFIL